MLIVLSLIIQLTAVSAIDGSSGAFLYFSFEDAAGGSVESSGSKSFATDTNNIFAIDGAHGKGVLIGDDGYIRIGGGQIGSALNGCSGVTLSAYVRAGNGAQGNLFTIYTADSAYGIRLSLAQSTLSLVTRSYEYEAYHKAEYTLDNSFYGKWVNVLVSIDYAGGIVKFFVNGEFKKRVECDFVSESFVFSGSSEADLIGDCGLEIDEVRIFDYAALCGEPKKIYDADFGREQDEDNGDKLSENLITQFKFDEGSGDTTVSTGKLEITSKLNEVEWDDGVSNSALRFHPYKKGMVNLGKNLGKSLENKSGVTFSGWLMINKNPETKESQRILALNISESKAALHITLGPNTLMVTGRSAPNEALKGKSFAWKEFGTWVHVTASVDYAGNSVKLFVNGEERTSSANTSVTEFDNDSLVLGDDPADTYLGGEAADPSYSKTLNGLMDELKFYDRALTADEARYIYSNRTYMSDSEKDTANYARLNSMTKNSVVMKAGSAEVFHDGARRMIDWDNGDIKPVLAGDVTMVPTEIFSEFCGARVELGENGDTADITIGSVRICYEADKTGYTVNGNPFTASAAPRIIEGKLFVPLRETATHGGLYVYYNPCGVIALGDKSAIIANMTESLAVWTDGEFSKSWGALPTTHHAQTRSVIGYSDPTTKQYLYSPSIWKLDNGDILSTFERGMNTEIKISKDDGESWQDLTKLDFLCMANIFECKGSLYCIGLRRIKGGIVIYRSDDNGATWTYPEDGVSGVIRLREDNTPGFTAYTTAPMPTLIANGRVFRTFETQTTEGWARGMHAGIISASVDSDLLNPDSWTVSNFLQLDKTWLPDEKNAASPGWTEGNAVLGPDGSVYNIIRAAIAPGAGYAAVLKLSDDYKTLSFEKFIDFEGMSKFAVRYDEQSGKYYSLVNVVTDPDYPQQRNVLSLAVSDDMYNWKIVETVLYPEWAQAHDWLILQTAFQYVDWVFDGDDIIMAVREADINAVNFHENNYSTFYRIKNFRQY